MSRHRTHLEHIETCLTGDHYVTQDVEAANLPLLQGTPETIFHQGNAGPQVLQRTVNSLTPMKVQVPPQLEKRYTKVTYSLNIGIPKRKGIVLILKTDLHFDIFELQEAKLPARLINTTNKHPATSSRTREYETTPVRETGGFEDVSIELDDWG
ncbi:hypothetical protein TNCV_1595361 [Trichonephila clavipes]|nr:hypothetical protein TNCV_1595361 [Trichonephila clavipes]